METNIEFKRGDKVNFLSTKNVCEPEQYKPVSGTYVWSVNWHLRLSYIIQHPDGKDKDYFVDYVNDGFECPFQKELKDGLKYISVCQNELELS